MHEGYGANGTLEWSATKNAMEAVTRARDAGGGTIVIEGRPGAGRTSVLHFISRNSDLDVRYIAVEQWVRSVPFAMFERFVEVILPKTHASLFPRLEQLDKTLDGDPAQQFIDQCQRILASIKEIDRLVILIDDLHLADENSQMLLSYLCRRLQNTGVVAVVTISNSKPCIARKELLGSPSCTLLSVTPLEHSAVERLAHSKGIYGLDSLTITTLIQHTAGWLEYVDQTLDAVGDEHWPQDPESLPLPESIVAEVLSPMTACERPEVWKLACTLAVLKEPPSLEILGLITGIRDLLPCIDVAVKFGVLSGGVLRDAHNTDQVQLQFVHPMAKQVIVREMLPSEHRDYHLRASEFLENKGERLLHRAAASLTRDPVLGHTITEFAERLGRMGRWEDAARFRFAAAKLMRSEDERQNEVLNGVDALASAGNITRAVPWLRTIEAMRPSSARAMVLAHVALHQGDAAYTSYQWKHAEQGLIEKSAQSIAASRRGLDMLCRWDAEGVVLWTNKAAALSKPGEAAQVEALAMRGVGLAAQGRTDAADESILQANTEEADGLQNQRYRLCAGWVGLLEGDLQVAHRELEAALPSQARGGSFRISLWAQAWLARTQFMQGDWDTALQGSLEGIRRAESAGIELMLPLLEWTAQEIQLWRGEQPRESRYQFTGRSRLQGYAAMEIPARMTRGVASKVRNDYAGMLSVLMPLVKTDPWRAEQMSFWHWQPELVHALVVADRVEEADELTSSYVENTCNASRVVRATAAVSQARVAAAQKQLDKAKHFFTEALRLTSIDGVATYHGRYMFSFGQMLRRAGRRSEAAEHLVSAREFFQSVSAEVMVDRCNRELRATGMLQHRDDDISGTRLEEHPEPVTSNTFLTAQEHAVAQLVVEGLTNRETARSLFIAEKTVQYHLTRIYVKFGIRSRTELARVYTATDELINGRAPDEP